MKKLLICLLLAFFGALPAYAIGGDTLDDSCADFSKVYEKSEYWQVKTDNEARYSDAERFHKTVASAQVSDAQYLTYMYNNTASCEVYFYYTDASTLNYLKIKYSNDNEAWTEAAVKKSTYDGCTGSWKGSIIKADNLPKGTKFIKIEVEKGAKPTSCCIGRVILTKGASSYENTPMAEPGENNIYIEECNSMDGVYEMSPNWYADTSASDLGAVGGRYMRTAQCVDNEYLTFKKPNVVSVDVKCYYNRSLANPVTALKAEFSDDNENWYEVPFSIKEGPYPIGDWVYEYITAETTGAPAQYMKLTVGDIGSSTHWIVNFDTFTFTMKPYYTEPKGDTTVENDIVRAVYDLPTTYKLYDKVSMYIAMYDKDGILTGLYQHTVDAVDGESSIHFEYEAPVAENTVTIKTYFWNALQGMHRLAETKKMTIH